MSEMVVPDGWEVKRLGVCCDVLDSQRVPLNSQERLSRKGVYPYYGANGVQGYIDDFIFEGESVLLAEDGGYFSEYATRPIANFVTGRYWVNNHAHILRAKSDILNRWIYYSLVHKNILKHINGGTRAKLNQSDLKEILVPLPPLPEQQKIASILTSVDEVIEKTKSQINKLQDLKKGTMNELLTKGISHTEFKDSPVGKIPVGWEVKRLDDVTIRGSGHTPNKKIPEYWNGCIKWVSLADSFRLDSGFISDTDKEISQEGLNNSSAVLHPKGTVILSRDAGVGKSAVLKEDMAVSQHFMVWKCDDRMDNWFLYYLLQHWKSIFESIAIGSTIKTIGLPYFKKLEIPLPPLPEQQKIASILSTMDSHIEEKQRKLEQTQSLKKSLMQDLLTGKVRVTVH